MIAHSGLLNQGFASCLETPKFSERALCVSSFLFDSLRCSRYSHTCFLDLSHCTQLDKWELTLEDIELGLCSLCRC